MASLKLCLIMLISMVVMVHGRLLGFNSSDQLIPESVDRFENQYRIIHLNDPSLSSHFCSHIYGFFPCAYNTEGYIFQIVVYQYLLFLAEMLLTKGSDRLFQILGTGIYGASVFRILKVLPGLITVIVSGLITSKAKAQHLVDQGVSVYAGTTILSLTLLWLMCVIFGRKERTETSNPKSSASNCMLSKAKLYRFMESGIEETDKETSYTAGIMLLSLIPFLVVELVNIFSTHIARRMVILIALVVSTTSLFTYFVYQIRNPWMQERSLENTKYENLLSGFLEYVQRHMKGKLINEDGQANVPVVTRLFNQIDKDNDQCLTPKELEDLIIGFKYGKLSVAEIWKAFDVNNDGKINEQEFIDGFIKYINEAKLPGKEDHTTNDILSEVIQPATNKKREERSKIEQVMSRIVNHVQWKALEDEQLVNDDGSPNIERIRSLFRQYDRDENKVISKSELEQLIQKVFGKMHLNHDEILKKVIKDFDKNCDNRIDVQEFVDGVAKWLKSIDKIKSLIKCLLTWDFNKSVFQIFLGIVMLNFLVAPLLISIRQFSDATGLPSSIVSFVIIPVALNARRALLAIFSANPMSTKIASLTFSEIYGGVIMNNLTGLITVLATIYAKDLKWDYSAEVLIMFVVCAIIGIFAFLRTNYPIWTCIIAFLLYPLSLVLFYVLRYLLGWN